MLVATASEVHAEVPLALRIRTGMLAQPVETRAASRALARALTSSAGLQVAWNFEMGHCTCTIRALQYILYLARARVHAPRQAH